MRKPGLTFEEHIKAGKELKQAYDIIGKWYMRFGNAYPRKDFAFNYLRKSYKHLGLARARADSSLFNDCPERAHTKVYYPGDEFRVIV